MKHLTAADRETMALELGVLKCKVLDELRQSGSYVESGETVGDHEVHSHADEAEAERLDDVRFAEIEVDRNRLRAIEEAQQRMADGLYGLCVDCDAEIPRERLLAQPVAIRCAACQAVAEARQHRR
jgi:DnaK suppressor protein